MMSYSFSPVATATVATVKPLKSDVRLSRITNTAKKWYLKPLKTVGIKNSTTGLLVSLLATCSTSPSYAEVGLSRFGINSDFVEELNKTNAITESYLTQISDNNDTFFTPKAYQYALICVLRLDVLILETRGFYEKLNRRKSKGRDAETSQPFRH